MERQENEIPWYKNWFDENYLLLYKHRNSDDAREQAALIQRTLNPGENCTILDLGCGEGRYTPFFKNIGCKITGMDLSATLIRSAKTKYPLLDLVLGDMRAIPFLPGKFDLILSLFTSFGYFEADEENRQVVGSIYRCLKPAGVFWLDFLNAASIEDNLVAESSYRISHSIQVLEKRKIMAGRIIKNIYFTRGAEPPSVSLKNLINKSFTGSRTRSAGGRSISHFLNCLTSQILTFLSSFFSLAAGDASIKNYQESIRLFTRDELIEMLKQAGFQLAGCFGNYRGDPWTRASDRTIIYGRKPN